MKEHIGSINGNDEKGNIRSNIKIPGKNEIYAQIAFQEQFYSGVLVGLWKYILFITIIRELIHGKT